MKKNTQTILIIINIILILLSSLFIIKNFTTASTKTVYVDSVKLFDSFAMTKEMKRAGEKEFNSRKSTLDNMYAALQSPSISAAQKEQLMQQFIKGKEELEQFNQTFAAEQTAKIWSRIRSYTSEFSKEKNYQLIVGSDNKQTILFANENIDITNDLLTYLNKKYEGI